MASGVKVSEECNGIFRQVKMNVKNSEKLQYAVFRLSDDLTKIVPDDSCPKDIHDFDCLVSELPADDGRYVIYDYPFVTKDGANSSKLIMLMWVPGNLNIKKKMLYASSKSAIKTMVNDELPEFQCDCREDVCCDDIISKLRK